MTTLKPSIAVKVARIVDAKGSFSYIGQNRYMRLAVAAVDQALIVWLYQVAGGCLQVKTLASQHYFVVTWYGRGLRALLPQIQPFLIQKKEHAEITAAHLATVQSSGRHGTSASVHALRAELRERLAELRWEDRHRPT